MIALSLVLAGGGVMAHTARAGGSNTATTITSSLNPANHYDRVQLQVIVTDQSDACVSQGICTSPTGTGTLTGFGHDFTFGLRAASAGVSWFDYTTLPDDLPTGTYPITASYAGNGTSSPSQGSVDQTVTTVQSTRTTLSQDRPSSWAGEAVTFTATVSTSYGHPTVPSGQMQFYEGGNPYGGPLSVTPDPGSTNSASAQVTTTTLSGTQTFVARYLADNTWDTSVSQQVTHSVVSPAVTVSLSTDANPSLYGQSPVNFLVSVQSTVSGEPTPTGTVTVYLAGNPIYQGNVDSSGSFRVDISFDIGLGDNYLTANYYGDSTYPATGSGTLDQVVNQDSTTTTVTSSPNPSVTGQSVTFTSATAVVAPGGATPTGAVTFLDSNSNVLATRTLDSSGHASFTTSSLTAGHTYVHANYDGDTYCTWSGSGEVDQVVTQATPPAVSAVSPTAGSTAGGTTITITGTNFISPAAVQVAGVAATNVVVVSPTQLTAVTPAHAGGTVAVQVITGGGKSAWSPGDWYAYGAPTVTALSPHVGSSNGGTAVTVTGTGFVPGVAVAFGGVAGTKVSVVSPSRLTVTAPSGTAGTTVDVTVTSAAGTSATSSPDVYSYAPPPTVTAVGPRAGSTAGGTKITVTGTNFSSPATVRVGGISATNVVVVSATQITATTSADAAGTVDVRVVTGTGASAASRSDWFAYGAPAVVGLSVHSGSHAGGTVVTIAGSGFVPGATVSFGTVAGLRVTVVSGKQITVTAPAGTAGTTVDVTVTNPAGPSATSTADRFTYT